MLSDVIVIHRSLGQTVGHGSIRVHAVKQDKCEAAFLLLCFMHTMTEDSCVLQASRKSFSTFFLDGGINISIFGQTCCDGMEKMIEMDRNWLNCAKFCSFGTKRSSAHLQLDETLPLDQILQMILQSLLRSLKHFCIPCKVYYSNLEQKMTWYVLRHLNISTCWRFHLSIISYLPYLFAWSCLCFFFSDQTFALTVSFAVAQKALQCDNTIPSPIGSWLILASLLILIQ